MSNMKGRQALRAIFQYFLQGLIIIAPIAITVYAVTALFTFIDNILPDLIQNAFPFLMGSDEFGKPTKIPGLGFILVVLTVILVGEILVNGFF